MSFIGGTVLSVITNITGENDFVRLLVSQLILIIPTLFYIIGFKLDIRETIRFRKIKASNVILLVIFAYLITPFMSLLSAISMLFSTNFIQGEVNNIISNNSLLLSVFVVAFIPCVLEESVYRGIFYNEYRKINTRKGIILSGLLFGFLHMNFNQFIYAFAMGMIFALLIEATDSIVSSMIVHFVINGTSVVTAYLMPKLSKIVEDTTGQVQDLGSTKLTHDEIISAISYYAVLSVVTTILAYIVYKKIAKNSGRTEIVKNILSRKKGNKQEEKSNINQEFISEYNNYYDTNYNQVETYSDNSNQNKKLLSIPLIFGILICIFFMIFNEVLARV
jgi:membrane protease YdiL (CAAX protease family)